MDITFLLPDLIKIPKTLLSSDKLHERTNKTNWNPEETARCLWNLNCINYHQLYLKLNITSLENLIVAQYNCSHWKGISRKCETPEIWCQSWSIFPQVPFLHMRDSDVSYLELFSHRLNVHPHSTCFVKKPCIKMRIRLLCHCSEPKWV